MIAMEVSWPFLRQTAPMFKSLSYTHLPPPKAVIITYPWYIVLNNVTITLVIPVEYV